MPEAIVDAHAFLGPPDQDGLESAKPDLQSVFKKPGAARLVT
jgi:hypothetical protein